MSFTRNCCIGGAALAILLAGCGPSKTASVSPNAAPEDTAPALPAPAPTPATEQPAQQTFHQQRVQQIIDQVEKAYANGEAAYRKGHLPEAKAEFDHAVALNAEQVKASYFLGLAAEQDGRPAEAATIWRAMLAKAPADAPWRPLVQDALARVGGSPAPALSNDAVAAAKDMNETDRNTMIRGMVERLANRLKQNGDDVEGWLRLVRAYMVMGDRDKARSALTDARQAVAGDAEHLRQLNEGLKNLGLDG